MADPLEGAEDHGRGGARHRLVLDRPGDLDQRALAEHAGRGRRLAAGDDRAVDRGAVGLPDATARAPAPRGRRARPRGTRPRGGASPRRRASRRGSRTPTARARARRSAAPTSGSCRRRGPCAQRRRGSPGPSRRVHHRLHITFNDGWPLSSVTDHARSGIVSARPGYVSGAMDPEPILLTGASGYVGSHLLDELLSRGRRVRALVRDPSRSDLPAQVEVRQGDAVKGDRARPGARGRAAPPTT